MASEMNLLARLQGQTPKFFKRVINIAMTLAGGGGVLVGVEAAVPGFQLPAVMLKIAQWLIVGGLVAASVSKTTITAPSTYTAPKDEELNK